MEMNKKITISIICLIIAFMLFALIWYIVKSNNRDEEILNDVDENLVIEENENSLEISNFSGTEIEDVTTGTSSDIGENDTRYLLKSVNDYIYVYYLSDDNDEFLYKKTDISVDYLSQEDMDDLEVGIEVVGMENLNKILEDFE